MNFNPLRWFRQRRQLALFDFHRLSVSLSVGQRVLTPKNNIGNVRAIVGDEAWVRTGKGQNIVVKLDLLRTPEY